MNNPDNPRAVDLDRAFLAVIAFEGQPGGPLAMQEGLNDKIRQIAQNYNATLIDLFIPLSIDQSIGGPFLLTSIWGKDCVHPSTYGYDVIRDVHIACHLGLSSCPPSP